MDDDVTALLAELVRARREELVRVLDCPACTPAERAEAEVAWLLARVELARERDNYPPRKAKP